MEQESLKYTIIPFAEPVSTGPIRTFVDYSNIHTKTKSKLKYSFTKEELSMSNTELQTYIKLNNFSTEKKLECKRARRRTKNCIYSQRYREKRKNKNTLLTNTLNDDSIIDQDVPDLLYCIYVPGLIHYTYIPYITYIYR